MISVVLERFWTHFWICALNGVLYLRKKLNLPINHGVSQISEWLLLRSQQHPLKFLKHMGQNVLTKQHSPYLIIHLNSLWWELWVTYRLLKRDPKTIKLSSMLAMISDVLSPLRSSSPRVLKLANVKVLLSHSAITCFSFCSISRSFTALMQISFKWMPR